MDDAFSSAVPDDEVLFQLTVTKTWLRQVIVALTLICRSSYRGVVEFLRDLLGVPISISTVHQRAPVAQEQAGVVNRGQDLSGIRAGLHDEIFQGAMPVLAGVHGIPVINGYKCFTYETSKALQLMLMQSLGIKYPKARVVNHPSKLIEAAEGLRFP